MSEPIVSIDYILAEAQKAAQVYSDVNAACPYPFYTGAGKAFKKEFTRVRLAMFMAENAANAQRPKERA
jgi:hypothetical protein